jgi:hypothetical protein
MFKEIRSYLQGLRTSSRNYRQDILHPGRDLNQDLLSVAHPTSLFGLNQKISLEKISQNDEHLTDYKDMFILYAV